MAKTKKPILKKVVKELENQLDRILKIFNRGKKGSAVLKVVVNEKELQLLKK